jgi:hypothetical protein
VDRQRAEQPTKGLQPAGGRADSHDWEWSRLGWSRLRQ